MTLPRQRLALVSLLMFACAFVLLFGFAAHAQTAPAGPPDVAQVAAQLVDGIRNGQWWIVASLVVSLLTWALRAGVFPALPGKLGVWMAGHPLVGLATPFVLSAIGGVVSFFASGQPFGWGTLAGEVIKVGAGAVAAFIAAKKIAEASVLGAVARGEVSTPAPAIALLEQGPQRVVALVPAAPQSIEDAAKQLLDARPTPNGPTL